MKIGVWLGLLAVLGLAGCAEKPVQPPVGWATCDCGIQGPEQDLLTKVGDRVFFDFDKAALSTDSDTTLARQAAWLAKYPAVNVLVAGNADARGTETYNLALGAKRAEAAKDYLLAQGVAAARITTVSYGKDCPVAAGDDAAAYQQNRNAITSMEWFNPQNCH
jgi:peptidoglycan-associated lipoprotein